VASGQWLVASEEKRWVGAMPATAVLSQACGLGPGCCEDMPATIRLSQTWPPARKDLAMAFRDRKKAKHINTKRCEWCGWSAGRRHAAHIIDEAEHPDWNGLCLCPNCATVFDEVIRPKLYRALKEYGAMGLPESWKKDNKISEAVAEVV